MATISEALAHALQHHQAGRLQEAEALYRQILQAQPNHPDALHLLGVIAHQVGQEEVAVTYISRAIELNAVIPEYRNNLGEAYRAQGRMAEAAAHYRQALALNPSFAEAHYNLGLVLQGGGKPAEAIEHYLKAVALKPAYAEAHNNLGNALKEQGNQKEAEDHYRLALTINPSYAAAHYNMGIVLQEQGRLEEAVAQYHKALALKPTYAEACNNLGLVLREQGKLDEAATLFRQALTVQPSNVEAVLNLGNALKDQGNLEEAMACYRQATALKPTCAEAYNNLGTVLQKLRMFGDAEACYRQAVKANPAFGLAYANLGKILAEQGKHEEAVALYRQALDFGQSDGVRILMATALPVIFESKEHLLTARRHFTEQVSELIRQDLSLKDPATELGVTNFYLAYQGFNDCKIQQMLGRMYGQACPALNYIAAHCRATPRAQASSRIKLGFIAMSLGKQTILGVLARGIIAELSRGDLSVSLILFQNIRDDDSTFIPDGVDRIIVLPPVLSAAQDRIAKEQFDILCYVDIGLDPLIYFLAFSRLAPVQCALWSHPVTTGIPTIDCFISSRYLEPPNAGTHYTEKLVRLRHLPLYYSRPVCRVPLKSRGEFGFNENQTLYLCPQSLFKLHPDFDEVIGQILQKDQSGELVLIEGMHAHWTELLVNRFRRTIPDVADRIRILPRQTEWDFQGLLSVADVILDPLHWSGGITTLDALALGTPVVTLPGKFMRGRVTYAFYKQMGVLECVATANDEYVKLAVRLGKDRKYREKIKAKILASNAVLYENPSGARELERFFFKACEAARKDRKRK